MLLSGSGVYRQYYLYSFWLDNFTFVKVWPIFFFSKTDILYVRVVSVNLSCLCFTFLIWSFYVCVFVCPFDFQPISIVDPKVFFLTLLFPVDYCYFTLEKYFKLHNLSYYGKKFYVRRVFILSFMLLYNSMKIKWKK